MYNISNSHIESLGWYENDSKHFELKLISIKKERVTILFEWVQKFKISINSCVGMLNVAEMEYSSSSDEKVLKVNITFFDGGYIKFECNRLREAKFDTNK